MYKDNVRRINELIFKVTEGVDLSGEETREVWDLVATCDQEGYWLTALTAALHAKGETVEELWGLCESNRRLGVKVRHRVKASQITDLAGTGGSRIKTMNVSTAASFVVAAGGITVAKQAGFAQTSPTGSADVFEAMGIGVFKLTKKQIEKTLEEVGICPLFLSAISPKLQSRGRVARKVFVEQGLAIGSPFHVAAFAYSPTQLTKRVYGCYAEKYMELLAELFRRLKNERTMIVHGEGGFPEVSVIGRTRIVEQVGDKIKEWWVKPEDMGLNTAKVEEIETGGRKGNLVDFMRVMFGSERGAKRDMVVANAAAAFYVMGKVNDLESGVRRARELIDEGWAGNKVEQLVDMLGSKEMLARWKRRAGLGVSVRT